MHNGEGHKFDCLHDRSEIRVSDCNTLVKTFPCPNAGILDPD